jgi:curli biogenesis system outer membrane secretion channel CsgG
VKKVVALLTGLMLLVMIPVTAGADFKKTKVAVLDFQLQGNGYETDDMGLIVAEWFITALVREGRFDVVERALLNKILAEQ